jgi:hypothetical protein
LKANVSIFEIVDKSKLLKISIKTHLRKVTEKLTAIIKVKMSGNK